MTASTPTARDPGDAERPALPTRLVRYAVRYAEPTVRRLRAGARRVDRPRDADAGEEGRSLEHHWRWSACNAPMTALYLDQFGKARACCQNTEHPLGDVAESTLREIWDGADAQRLRTALADDDLSLGCAFCAWERTETNPRHRFLNTYDEYPTGWRGHPRWPRQLEFSVTNTCNLQCVMCNGDWSSSIRSQREHRPALASAYPERFYRELVEFIPHLRNANFTGGEPFLGTEPQRIMELLVEHGASNLVMGVVTNGTIFNERVERILDQTTPWISVSLDGGTQETYERIRIGASFPKVLANVDRFAAIVADHGVGMNLTHCLMVDNWETFPELLLLAEERDLGISINTVRFPEIHSLYHLPPEELATIIDTLTRRSDELRPALTGPRAEVWDAQLHALAARRDTESWPEALGVPPEQSIGASGTTSVTIGRSRPGAP